MQERESIKAKLISFMKGIAFIGGVLGPVNPYEGLSPEEADTKVLESDWEAVGGDLRTAIDKISQCPQCGCPEVEPTWSEPDEDNQMEYHCSECGEYFIDED